MDENKIINPKLSNRLSKKKYLIIGQSGSGKSKTIETIFKDLGQPLS